MANDSAAYFTNSIAGVMSVGADINLTQADATPKFAVGQILQKADGSIYHYGYSSAGIVAGKAVSPTFASAGVVTTTGVKSITASTAVAGDTIAVGAAGSRYVQITVSGVTANLYRGGYFVIDNGSGKGYTYRIAGNTATGNPVSGDFRLELKEPLAVTLYTSTQWIIVPCMWNDLGTAETGTNNVFAGVSMGATTTTKPYGWFCTRGQVGCAVAGTVTAGQAVALSATAGSLMLAGFGGSTVTLLQGIDAVGYLVQPSISTGNTAVVFINSID